MQLARTALERCGHEFVPTLTGGGADANVFNAKGLPCLNLANGMREIHTADEHIAVADLDAMVEVTLALVEAARMALGLGRGVVTAILERRDRFVRLEVDGIACIAYPRLTGPVEVGDEVLVNEQARLLELGSGGFDVLYANLTQGLGLAPEEGAHVVSLPYTPGQVALRHGRRRTASSRRGSGGRPVVSARCTARSLRCAPRSPVSVSPTCRCRAARCRSRCRTR